MQCQICTRKVPDGLMEHHHLKPKERKGTRILVCIDCGNQLHQLFSNKELAKQYNTLDKILANKKIQNWVKWIQNKPNDFNVCMRRKK